MRPADFIHPEDAAALSQMEAIPGFASFVKKILAIGLENLQYGVNMASAIRLSAQQLPSLYSHLPPICQKLGIAEPEFYLQMDPNPNAWTFGDTRIFITITSGLVEMMDDEELDCVIAHECGHILCRHVLYHTIAQWLASGIASAGLLGTLAIPIQYAMFYWSRKSELSADRCASIVCSPEIVARTMARLSGGPKSITSEVNLQQWARQADQYEQIQNSGLWNKALQLAVIAGLDHPFSAVRVREILKWGQSDQYFRVRYGYERSSRLLTGEASADDASKCPSCGADVEPGWKFCRNCGAPLH